MESYEYTRRHVDYLDEIGFDFDGDDWDHDPDCNRGFQTRPLSDLELEYDTDA